MTVIKHSGCWILPGGFRRRRGKVRSSRDSQHGAPGLAEVYERHIDMTVDQAIDVAYAIMMTAQKFQENKQMMEANRAANGKIRQV
jgi:hypothetical protein